MNQEEFLTRLSEITTTDLHVYQESGQKRLSENYRQDNCIPRVYSPENINELIDVIRADCYTPFIRFVIDKDGLPLFGEDGKVVHFTPGHEEMCTGLCRTAGTLTFSQDYKSIVAINHSSGFFKPSFSSLFWGLNYLFSTDSVFKLGHQLDIGFSATDGSWQTISVNTPALHQVIEQLNLNIANFRPDAEHPFVTYSNELPITHTVNGISCSDSYHNLAPITESLTPSLVAQIGMFAAPNSHVGIAETEEDYSVFLNASSDEEDDNLIISPCKKARVC